MVHKQPAKTGNKDLDKTTGLYKIAAKIIKKVKTGSSYKSQLYQAQYPNKLLLNAVLMNVFKWEKVIDLLVEKSNILEKENNMDPELVYVLITELMWSKFGLKGNAKNILAIKKYKDEFSKLLKENELVNLTNAIPSKVLKTRYFRVNTLVTTLEDILKKLSQHKLNKLKTPKTYAEFLELIKSDKFKGNTFVQDIHIKELLVFNSKVKFYKFEEYNNGSLIIQDKASCLAAHLLNPEPGSTVLDMCAAPGMKTSHLAAIMKNTGKLYAVDRCKERYNIMQNMLEKYGVKNAETFNMDALTFPYYDDVKYILVDPSCSGSGIVDRVRNDSVGQNDQLQIRLKKLANVHAQLLNHALKSYPKLERLVYSTCSANHEENERVVDEALSVNGKFKLLDGTKYVKGWINKGVPGYDCSEMCLNAVPNVDCTNGFFIAVFVRRDFEEKEIVDEEASEETNEDLSEVIDKENIGVRDPSAKTNKNTSQKKKKNKKNKLMVKIENPKLVKKQKTTEKNENLEPAKKGKTLVKMESSIDNSEPAKKRKEISSLEPEKKCKTFVKSENVVESLEPTKKRKTTDKIGNPKPIKKSKTLVNSKISEENSESVEEKKEIGSPEPLKKKKKIMKTESVVENLKPTKTKKTIDHTDNSIPVKKCKTPVNVKSLAENSESVEEKKEVGSQETAKKSKTVKIENTEPIKKSKNVKRRERRLKLEQANGVTAKTKKSKKLKKEKV